MQGRERADFSADRSAAAGDPIDPAAQRQPEARLPAHRIASRMILAAAASAALAPLAFVVDTALLDKVHLRAVAIFGIAAALWSGALSLVADIARPWPTVLRPVVLALGGALAALLVGCGVEWARTLPGAGHAAAWEAVFEFVRRLPQDRDALAVALLSLIPFLLLGGPRIAKPGLPLWAWPLLGAAAGQLGFIPLALHSARWWQGVQTSLLGDERGLFFAALFAGGALGLVLSDRAERRLLAWWTRARDAADPHPGEPAEPRGESSGD